MTTTEVRIQSKADPNTKVYSGTCRSNCHNGCFLNVYVRDGKIVKTSMRDMPDTEYNRVCLRGLTHVDRVYSPTRLKTPLRRVGERGSGQFEEISWDEAINEVASKWKKIAKESGPEAIGFCPGSGVFGSINGVAPGDPRERLRNIFGYTFLDKGYDMAWCWVSPVRLGISENMQANEPADMVNAKTLVIWASDPLKAVPQIWHFMNEATKRGGKLVVIDPIYSETASKADMWIRPRPGSDGALSLTMIKYVIDHDLLDREFMKKSTDCPFLVKEDGRFLRQSDLDGKVSIPNPEGEDSDNSNLIVIGSDGLPGPVGEISDPELEGEFTVGEHRVRTVYEVLKERASEWTLEKGEEMSGVPQATIVEFARMYAEGPSTIYHGYGLDRYANGHHAYTANITLAALTGNIGKPGCSVGWSYTMGNIINAGGPELPENLQGTKPGPVVGITELPPDAKPFEYGDGMMHIRSALIYAHNIVGNRAQRKNTVEWLKNLEFVVVNDIDMTETTKYADIVLPASYWFEYDEICVSNQQHPYITWNEKAIEPMFDTKPDYEIAKLLGEALGVGEAFPDYEEYMESLLESEGAHELGITLERLKKEKVLNHYKQPQIHGEGGVFPTPTGRVVLYFEDPTPRIPHGQKIDIDHERAISWEPPHEAWYENPLKEKYPIVYMNGHSRWRTHSQWHNAATLRELDPEPYASVNPADAQKRGVVTGDLIRIFNDRGHVVVRARISHALPEGVLDLPKGWQEDQYIAGHYQDLTSDYAHPMVENNAFCDTLVDFEKVER